MTNEELERIKQYSDKIQATGGIVGFLTDDETGDFQELLQDWFVENEVTREKKEVPEEQYVEVLERHKREVYTIAIQGCEISILYGFLALAADHPAFKKLGWPTLQFFLQIRWWCREKFSEWGFTPEAIEYLEKMKEDAQGNITEMKSRVRGRE